LRYKFIVLLGFFLVLSNSWATQDQTYGLGGSSTGRASSVAAEIENPFAALINPALLAAQPTPLFSLSASSTSSYYQPLTQVLVDSPKYRTQTATPQVQDFQPAGLHSTLWSVGFTYPFPLPRILNRRKMGLGVTFSGPFGKLRSFSSGTPYDFSLMRYGTADTQFKATVGSALEILTSHLYFGAGLSLYITAAGAADAYVMTENPTGRLNLDVGLNSAAIVGLYGTFATEGLKHHGAFVYRQAVRPTFEQQFTGSVQVVDGTTSLDIPALLRTSLYYEPHALELEWQTDWDWAKLSAGISYQLWSQYEPSILQIQATHADRSVSNTTLPALPLKDTFNPRASVEIPFAHQKRAAVSVGYQFRPTPITDLSGPANLLDTDVHVMGLGARYRFPETELVPFPVTVAIHGQYHLFNARQVVKNDPGYIGSPGYKFDGSAYTYGVSLQAAF
jgi:long-subunit fatty acid transport protein